MTLINNLRKFEIMSLETIAGIPKFIFWSNNDRARNVSKIFCLCALSDLPCKAGLTTFPKFSEDAL